VGKKTEIRHVRMSEQSVSTIGRRSSLFNENLLKESKRKS